VDELIGDLDRLQPSEVLVPYETLQNESITALLKFYCVTPQGKQAFDATYGKKKMEQIFTPEVCKQIETDFSIVRGEELKEST